MAVPLEFQTTDDFATTISKWGKLVSWENDPRKRGRIIAKVRVTELIDVPRSIRWSEGEVLEEDSWTSSVEIIHQEMQGEGPADEDPIPPPGVDPHLLPQQPFNGVNPINQPGGNVEHDQEDDEDDWEEDGHWALQQPQVAPEIQV